MPIILGFGGQRQEDKEKAILMYIINLRPSKDTWEALSQKKKKKEKRKLTK